MILDKVGRLVIESNENVENVFLAVRLRMKSAQMAYGAEMLTVGLVLQRSNLSLREII